MARQGIFTGSSPNDGTGDSLAAGAVKVNANFSELYSTFGDGDNLISYVNTAGVSTVAGNLTGNPSISVTKVVGAMTSSIIPFLWNNYSDLPFPTDYHGAVAHAHDTGKLYYAHSGSWVELVNVASDGRVGTGTEGLNFGLVEAQSFSGDGTLISGVKIPVRNQGLAVGLAGTVNFVGAGVTVENNGGIATVTVSPTGGGITTETDPVFTASAASGITTTNISNWNTAYGWGDHSVVGYATVGYVDAAVVGVSTFSGDYNDLINKPTVPVNINDLSDVNAGAPSTGQVLKWSGAEWQASADLTAAGAGIGLSDLSVTVTAPGINTLTYNNVTGVFQFTPADLSSYLTNVTITAGANIDVVETSEGNFIITSTASGGSVGSAGTWAVNASGIHTSKNVGVGTELSSSALWVEGDGYFSGVVTATRFESTSSGTPTIDSPNNLNINAVIVAISTDLTVGGSIVAAGQTVNSTGVQVTGVTTSTSFKTNSTVGDGSDVGFAIKYYVTEDGTSSAYRFAGPGLVNTTNNPTFYLQRGFTYIFENSTGGSHPFRIQFTGTTTGVGTYVSGSQTGTQVFTVPFDAPATYEYECTIHSSMKGTFNVA